MKIPLLLVAALLAGAGCSSLKVTAMKNADGTKVTALHGVPYYPPRQDFVVSELGLDENGKPTPNAVLKVELVTRPDTENGFVITNSPGPFSTSEFEVNRDSQGRLTSLTAKTEDKTVETVTALASFVVKVAGTFAAEPLVAAKTLDELQAEIDAAVQKKTELEKQIKNLKKDLSADSATKPSDSDKAILKQIKDLTDDLKIANETIKRTPLLQEMVVVRAARLNTLKAIEKLAKDPGSDGKALTLARENLAALNDRMAAIQASLGESAAAKGVTKSGTRDVTFKKAKDQSEAATLAKDLSQGSVGIYVVPR